ncbi:MAG: alpha/beta hydrolase [Polyangiaceae bacterium]|nr:alpha/beta hydrolase [Polyangiaceae bacterium]
MDRPVAPFTPHADLVPGPGRARLFFVLHGAFGSGNNFRLFAKKLAAEHPDTAFWLVDVRGHGRSRGAEPPHDLAAAAADLARLEAAAGVRASGVIGHSLGGKLALAYAASRPGELDEVWVLDADPGPRSKVGSPTLGVLALLRELSGPHAARADFVAAVCARGLSRTVADWLAMSLERTADGYRVGLELDVVAALLESYFGLDLWPEVERPDGHRALPFVVGGASDAVSPAGQERLGGLAAAGALGVRLHVLPGAGHWLHVDAPDALRALFARERP